MKGISVISTENIVLNPNLESKGEAIEILSDHLVASGVVINKERFIEDIYERENRGSTFTGYHLAIPHGFSNYVTRPAVAIAKSDNPFTWDKNGNLAKLIIMFAIPENTDREEELEVLRRIASSLGDVELVKKLLNLNVKEDFIELIYRYMDDN